MRRQIGGRANDGTSVSDDDRTTDERRLDHEIDSMYGYWRWGVRLDDWSSWQDGGLSWFYDDQESESGCAGLEGAALRDAVLAMDDQAMGWALGLSRDVVSIVRDELRDRSRFEVQTEGLAGARLVFDEEREIMLAVSPEGVRTAGLHVRVEPSGDRIRCFEFEGLVAWTTGRELRDSTYGPAARRRRLYKVCAACRRAVPPEDQVEHGGGSICLECSRKRPT